MAKLNPRITHWSGKKVWLVGASSGIGAALAGRLRAEGAVLALSARRKDPLDLLLASSDNDSMAVTMDVTDCQSVKQAYDHIHRAWGEIDLVVWLAGTYLPMHAANFDADKALRTIQANIVGPYNGLAALLPAMLNKQCHGIAMVSSVAGYRGLPKSLVYGPTKAALTNMTESLYLDMHDRGVGVWVINPGFVETPLTEKNDFKMPALISPTEAAEKIIEGFATGHFEIHFPKRFTRILKTMRILPYWLYFRATRRLTKAGDTEK